MFPVVTIPWEPHSGNEMFEILYINVTAEMLAHYRNTWQITFPSETFYDLQVREGSGGWLTSLALPFVACSLAGEI